MELVVTISIFAILLGIMIPSLNAVTGFRVRRAAESIGASLDRTKTEAMNRLVGEMMLERRSDGYYISFYLDRGRTAVGHEVKADQPEKIGPARLAVSYEKNGTDYEMKNGDKLILTYDREDGSFRCIQTEVMTQEKIQEFLNHAQDIPFFDDTGVYCTKICVRGGGTTRILTLDIKGGTYKLTAG